MDVTIQTNVNSPSSLSSSLYKSSLQLTSFYTIYENNNLIVLWDYNDDSIIHDITQFQIILEQEIIADHTMNPNVIVRRSGSLSSNIKKYIIRHVQPNMKYFVCISITRFGHGTDKYCRDILTTVSSLTTDYRLLQSVSTSSTKIVNSLLWNLLSNKSVLFGFFVGTTITSSLLLILTLTCHKIRKYRQEKSTTANLFEQHYMYADGNYSNSICEHHDEQKLYDYLKYQSKTSRKRQSSCLSLCFRKKLINHRQLSTTSFPTTSDNANYTTCRGGGDDNTSASTLSESEQLSKHVYQEIGNDLIEGHKNFQIVRHYFDPKHEQTALRRPIHITIFPNENSITSKTNLLL
ncbi:unnamed protein product [Didymodactylos carnosus]|uniref:Uncharacterized protein n=1 Tax=Didymodactylos carnosus TaxID=1234261 RepID=A0A8S2E9B0_9BILA|nr:unnamed protein product [Didymodactylos carnosus]CAF3947425.1 unnamed protein product [Didymodactylos carnosus]